LAGTEPLHRHLKVLFLADHAEKAKDAPGQKCNSTVTQVAWTGSCDYLKLIRACDGDSDSERDSDEIEFDSCSPKRLRFSEDENSDYQTKGNHRNHTTRIHVTPSECEETTRTSSPEEQTTVSLWDKPITRSATAAHRAKAKARTDSTATTQQPKACKKSPLCDRAKLKITPGHSTEVIAVSLPPTTTTTAQATNSDAIASTANTDDFREPLNSPNTTQCLETPESTGPPSSAVAGRRSKPVRRKTARAKNTQKDHRRNYSCWPSMWYVKFVQGVYVLIVRK